MAPEGQPLPVCKTVFLLRHGEAMHNIKEKHEKKRASEEADALGYAKGTEVHKAMVEAARVSAIESEEFRDASLSEAGVRDAMSSEAELQKLAKSFDIDEPGEVLVSPLLRTLQTASVIFPTHPKVRVCELLRERKTGRPCDVRQTEPDSSQDPSFAKMDWSSLMNSDDASNEAITQGTVVEDVAMLRRRTAHLVDVLQACSEESICLITHKGYLRELERGPLGRPEATEFSNCEVRIYDIILPGDGTMVASLRHCNGEMSLEAKPASDPVGGSHGLLGKANTNECAEHRTLTESERDGLVKDLFQIACSSSNRVPSKELVACF